MAKIYLISCVSQKLTRKAKAKDLYVSTLFRSAYQYARQKSADKIFILSAKYGLVKPEEEIEPYDQTLKDMSTRQRKEWAQRVLQALGRECDLQHDHFVILAGEKYREFLLPNLKSYEVPLQGLPIGKQIQFLQRGLK
ncbi:MAG: DUF6884 domain-containing protein [Chloroflexota bacterium]